MPFGRSNSLLALFENSGNQALPRLGAYGALSGLAIVHYAYSVRQHPEGYRGAVLAWLTLLRRGSGSSSTGLRRAGKCLLCLRCKFSAQSMVDGSLVTPAGSAQQGSLLVAVLVCLQHGFPCWFF
jgi:hypothetical protein